ncbi:MAG: hypothetical protein LBJ84_01240 [Oscillospiraceae bacterium]|jgi:hypothetical protein|nr:hypothetical protein [Oscillospiraceae bacterium]
MKKTVTTETEYDAEGRIVRVKTVEETTDYGSAPAWPQGSWQWHTTPYVPGEVTCGTCTVGGTT